MSEFYTNVSLSKNNIFVIGYRDGQRYSEVVPYKPSLFLPSKNNRKTEYQALRSGDIMYVERIVQGSIRDAREYLENYSGIENFSVYGMERFIYPFIYDTYPGRIEYDTDLIKVWNIDIETANEHGGFPNIETANEAITLVGVGIGKKRIIFGYGDYVSKEKRIQFVRCKDEKDMLSKFLNLWTNIEYRPDIVTGWNIEKFDIPYIVNRLRRLFGAAEAKRLSPWGILKERKIPQWGREIITYEPVGVSVLDYYDLYRKFTYTQLESYSLDHVALVETARGKLDYSEFASLHDLYKNNYQKFVDYNVTDIDRVADIDDKNRFIELVLAIAYDAKVNFNDALTSVLLWDVIIHNYLMDRKVVIPQNKMKEAVAIPGGFVKDPQIGMHKWVVSFDLTSLYPHLIIQNNISPETLVYYDQNWNDEKFNRLLDPTFTHSNPNTALAANGSEFRRDFQGVLPALMRTQFDLRVKYKNEMMELKKSGGDKKKIAALNNAQMAKKIQLNSAYGATANPWFRYYDHRLAAAVTLSGQCAIKWVAQNVNLWLNMRCKTENFDFVIASDTDSIYLNFGKMIECRLIPNYNDDRKMVKEIIAFAQNEIQKVINKSYDNLAKRLNAYENAMSMKIEAVCFPSNVSVRTKNGNSKISQLKVGDFVLTHKGRYKKITQIFKNSYDDEYVKLYYGRKKHMTTCLTGTAAHPILVERNGKQLWIPMNDVNVGDVVFTLSKQCPKTGDRIPYWRNYSINWNGGAAKALCSGKSNFKKSENKSTSYQHLVNDIIPFCEQKRKDGWKIVPTGGHVVPDAIGFKDGRVVAFEIEKTTGYFSDFKKQKYENSPILNFLDGVEWLDWRKPMKASVGVWYEESQIKKFVKVKITSKHIYRSKRKNPVFNIEVEDDHSYVAGGLVVHNCNKAIWKAKKMYVANVLNSEGVDYDPPDIKMMGIETIRSSTPAACKAALKEAIKLIINTDETTVQIFISQFREKHKTLSFDEVAFPRGINGITKYAEGDSYKKGTPIHVKGAISYNQLIKKFGLSDRFSPIFDGDKIKFCYLLMPNPYFTPVLAAPKHMPKEFEIEKYIDWEKQFDKSFLEPIRHIMEVIPWSPEFVANLEGFFE